LGACPILDATQQASHAVNRKLQAADITAEHVEQVVPEAAQGVLYCRSPRSCEILTPLHYCRRSGAAKTQLTSFAGDPLAENCSGLAEADN